MNEELQPGGRVQLHPQRISRFGVLLRIIAWCGVAAVVGLAIQSARSMMSATLYRDSLPDSTAHAMGLVAPNPKRLIADFTDNQGRLLADPPTSPAAFLDPPTLVVAHIHSDDSEAPHIPWAKFEKHLASITGRNVEDAPFENSPEQLADVKAGKITVVALHAAETPFLVNNYGFQPVAAFGDDGGINGNRLDIIVSADSPITKAADLRGKSLVCTVPSSITGYRAAIALLLKDEHLRPNVDYTVTWSLGQKKSIRGVTEKKYSAAAVSDDKLQTLIDDDNIDATLIRKVYTSEVIPRTTIGWFYNLKPELVDKIRQAILTFRPNAVAGVSDAPTSQSAKTQHFISIDYKKNFELVRLIDDSFDPRLGVKPSKVIRAAAKDATAEPATHPTTAP